MRPERAAFSRRELRLIDRLRTPLQVQRFLNGLPYNTEPPPGRATLRSFRGVVRHHTAHCLEAALAAAVILEQHGYPPLVLSFESIDNLDHVLFVYRAADAGARSRDRAIPGLHGRKPVFRTARDLALSYVDPYIDFTRPGHRLCRRRSADAGGVRLEAFGAERLEGRAGAAGLSAPPIRSSNERINRLRRGTGEYQGDLRTQAALEYRGMEKWTELPEF